MWAREVGLLKTQGKKGKIIEFWECLGTPHACHVYEYTM